MSHFTLLSRASTVANSEAIELPLGKILYSWRILLSIAGILVSSCHTRVIFFCILLCSRDRRECFKLFKTFASDFSIASLSWRTRDAVVLHSSPFAACSPRIRVYSWPKFKGECDTNVTRVRRDWATTVKNPRRVRQECDTINNHLPELATILLRMWHDNDANATRSHKLPN